MSNLVTKETTKEEFNQAYKNYPEIKHVEFHSARINPIFWDIEPNSTVLDLGCNTGNFMERLLSEKKGMTVKGIDLSVNCVNIAKEKGLDVVLGDGESLPYDDSSFDYVVLMEVLVHVFDPKKLLTEIKRVLKKDGILLGSSPLKDLEMNIWDDKRLHHAYYTDAEIYGMLKEHFYDVHFKILKGAQFSMGMAGTYLSDKNVEVLFKCGAKNMKPWDYKLLDKDVLRVWMGPTQNAAVVTVRMTDYAKKMNQMERCDILYDRFTTDDTSHPGKWQEAFKRTESNRPGNMIVVNQMEGLLKISDLTIWQVTDSWSVIAFFNTLKAVYPKKPFITEMDDWFFDIPSYNIASNPYRPNSDYEKIIYEQLKMSDAVICSTQFISDSLKSIFPSLPVYIVKNSIDFDAWDAAKPNPLVKKKDGMIRIGYTGSGNHGLDLKRVEKPLLAILDEFPNVEFIVAGKMRDNTFIKHDRAYSTDNWTTIDKWPEAVKGWQMDIGIAPLVDSNFNRAKSNLRWLEYSALSIPTVASKVYPFENSIRDGIDGILANSQQSWYDALRSLILDSPKRSKMGAEAYRKVKKEYNMNKVALTYKSILNTIKRG